MRTQYDEEGDGYTVETQFEYRNPHATSYYRDQRVIDGTDDVEVDLNVE